jgi:hypothetical protein
MMSRADSSRGGGMGARGAGDIFCAVPEGAHGHLNFRTTSYVAALVPAPGTCLSENPTQSFSAMIIKEGA